MTSEQMNAVPARPTVTEDTITRAARKLAARHGWDDQMAADIAACFDRFDDGYALAKRLEDDYLWSIDAGLVNDLDMMSHMVEAENRRDGFAWEKENNILPPLPIGATIKEGVITGIFKYGPATYEVQEPNKPPTTRALIHFEDAKLVVEAE